MNGDLPVLTNTAISALRCCQRLFKLRYIDEIVPLEEPEALSFGSMVHRVLGKLAASGLNATENWIIESLTASKGDRRDLQNHAYALSMARWYWKQIRSKDPIRSIAREYTFEVPIVNPDTGAESKTFRLAGKVDEVFELADDPRGADVYLHEYKTASKIDRGYIERLWVDRQIRLYLHGLNKLGTFPALRGVVYDVLQKPSIRIAVEESEAEFEERRQKLIARSKRGTTEAKRRMGETFEEFLDRLDQWYQEEPRFHREIILMGDEDLAELQEELWTMTQVYLEARRRGKWYMNTSYCFHFNRPCQYFQLCRSGGSELVKQTYYRHEPANQELRDEME